jgi:hypothetical protein
VRKLFKVKNQDPPPETRAKEIFGINLFDYSPGTPLADVPFAISPFLACITIRAFRLLKNVQHRLSRLSIDERAVKTTQHRVEILLA